MAALPVPPPPDGQESMGTDGAGLRDGVGMGWQGDQPGHERRDKEAERGQGSKLLESQEGKYSFFH